MTPGTRISSRALLATLLLAVAVPAAAKDKVKRERVSLALPVVLDAASAPGPIYSFRAGEFWGGQAARYRSAVTLDASLAVPDVAPTAVIAAGERLVELHAESKAWTGSVYCKTHPREKKLPAALLCVADRNGDGAMDQLWAGVAASSAFVVPYPDMRSLRIIEPVPFTRIDDPARLALQLGFYVSGTNPILGHHHFCPMLSTAGEVGYVLDAGHKKVSMRTLPNEFGIGGARLRVTGFDKETYQATVVQPFPSGERMIVGDYPTQTIYIYVPG